MLISYHANTKSSPRLPSWQPSLISFNTPIDSGLIIKPCTLKHFQVPILAPGLSWLHLNRLGKALEMVCINISRIFVLLQWFEVPFIAICQFIHQCNFLVISYSIPIAGGVVVFVLNIGHFMHNGGIHWHAYSQKFIFINLQTYLYQDQVFSLLKLL